MKIEYQVEETEIPKSRIFVTEGVDKLSIRYTI